MTVARMISLKKIEDRIIEMYDVPTVWPMTELGRWNFREKCLKHWAANEFLFFIAKSNKDLYSAADEFIKMMDDWSSQGDLEKERSHMFSVAYDVAVDLADQLYL